MRRKIGLSLHIGVHKTASTHLQSTIAANRDVLRSYGVSALLPGQLRRSGKRLRDRFDLDRKDPRAPTGLEILRRNADSDTTRLFASEENFIGGFAGIGGAITWPVYPNAARAIGQVVRRLAPMPVDVFLAIREPTEYLRSCFSQLLVQGNIERPGLFFIDAEPHRVDWVDLVQRIRAVEGLRWLGVWPYEAYPGNTIWIFRRMLRWRLGKLLIPPMETVNTGLSEDAVRQALAAIDDGREPLTAKVLRSSFPVGPHNPLFDPFPEDVRVASQANYARQIEHIRAMEGVDVLDGPPQRVANPGA